MRPISDISLDSHSLVFYFIPREKFIWNDFIPILHHIYSKINSGMNLFQNILRKEINMSSIINQDISIGTNLKSLRLRNKLSQEDVAAQLQIMGFTMSREIISQMELGRHNIRVSVLLALKELYHASFDEIFAD